MDQPPSTKAICRAVIQNLNGVTCLAAMWGSVLDSIPAGAERAALDKLPVEVQVYLRAIYAVQPSSLVSGNAASATRDAVIRWCKAQARGVALRYPGRDLGGVADRR